MRVNPHVSLPRYEMRPGHVKFNHRFALSTRNRLYSASTSLHNGTLSYSAQYRHDSTASPQQQEKIAILGAGITGLTAAYYLSSSPARPKITIYEASNRCGGWIDSRYVESEDGSKILFEAGPRNIRPAVPRGLHVVALVWTVRILSNLARIGPVLADMMSY